MFITIYIPGQHQQARVALENEFPCHKINVEKGYNYVVTDDLAWEKEINSFCSGLFCSGDVGNLRADTVNYYTENKSAELCLALLNGEINEAGLIDELRELQERLDVTYDEIMRAEWIKNNLSI